MNVLPVMSVTTCLYCSSVALERCGGDDNNEGDYDDDSNGKSLDTATAGVLSGLWNSALSLG